MTRVRYGVVAWMCFFAIVAYIHRGSLAVPAQQIRAELGLDASQLAFMFSGFFWAYALFQIPAGICGDRWGSRKAVAIFASLGSLAMLMSALSTGFAAMATSRVLMGVAQAGLFPAAVSSFRAWLPPQERGFANGLLGAAMSLGAMIGSVIAGALLENFVGWQAMFGLFAAVGFLGTAGFYPWFRDRPEIDPKANDAERAWIAAPIGAAHETPVRPTLSIWFLGTFALICAQQFFRAMGNTFYFTFFPTFLMEARGVGLGDTGFMGAFPLFSMMLGGVMGGKLMDWMLRKTGSPVASRHVPVIASLGMCVLFMLFAAPLSSPWSVVAFLTLAAWGGGFGGPAAYTVTIERAGQRVATFFAVMNMAGNFGAALASLLIYWVYETVRRGDPARVVIAWNSVIVFLAGIYAIALGCWVLLAFCDVRRKA